MSVRVHINLLQYPEKPGDCKAENVLKYIDLMDEVKVTILSNENTLVISSLGDRKISQMLIKSQTNFLSVGTGNYQFY